MKVIMQSPVEHDGKVLKAGETVDLPQAIAEALLAGGAAAAAAAVSRAKKQEAPAEPAADEAPAAE